MKLPLSWWAPVLLTGCLASCQSSPDKPATNAALVTSRSTAEGRAFQLPTDQLFRPGEAELLDQANTRLSLLAEQLRRQQPRQLIVRCYTDDQGDDNQNMALTQKRVQIVVDWLRAHGQEAPAEQQGMGEADPLVPNTTAANRAQNRRVEVVVGQ